MTENGRSIVALETGANWMALGEESDFFHFFFLLFMISHFLNDVVVVTQSHVCVKI
jgi:hypothetical protein